MIILRIRSQSALGVLKIPSVACDCGTTSYSEYALKHTTKCSTCGYKLPKLEKVSDFKEHLYRYKWHKAERY